MTREDKLYTMKMQELVKVADKLGIKINAKAAKSKAVEMILAAEEMNEANEKELAKEEAENDAYVKEVMQQKKDLGIECPKIDKVEIVSEKSKLVPMPGTEDSNWGQKHYEENHDIDPELIKKFVKKAQRLITAVSHDATGYHVTIVHNNQTRSFHDKNLQNIRSAIGKIYRGEE